MLLTWTTILGQELLLILSAYRPFEEIALPRRELRQIVERDALLFRHIMSDNCCFSSLSWSSSKFLKRLDTFVNGIISLSKDALPLLLVQDFSNFLQLFHVDDVSYVILTVACNLLFFMVL